MFGPKEAPYSSKTVNLLLERRASGEPITISVNGLPVMTIPDEGSFQQLLQLVDRLDLTAELGERLRDLNEGKAELIDIEEVREMGRKRYGVRS